MGTTSQRGVGGMEVNSSVNFTVSLQCSHHTGSLHASGIYNCNTQFSSSSSFFFFSFYDASTHFWDTNFLPAGLSNN